MNEKNAMILIVLLAVIAVCMVVSTTVLVCSAVEIRKWRHQYIEALQKLWKLEDKKE
jgi:hypothetical protein